MVLSKQVVPAHEHLFACWVYFCLIQSDKTFLDHFRQGNSLAFAHLPNLLFTLFSQVAYSAERLLVGHELTLSANSDITFNAVWWEVPASLLFVNVDIIVTII
jgi:hypothetical protein